MGRERTANPNRSCFLKGIQMSANTTDAVLAPWQTQKNVDASGKQIEREPEAGDYLSALSMLLGLVAFWMKVQTQCLRGCAFVGPFSSLTSCMLVPCLFSDQGIWLVVSVHVLVCHRPHEIRRHGLLQSFRSSDVSSCRFPAPSLRLSHPWCHLTGSL